MFIYVHAPLVSEDQGVSPLREQRAVLSWCTMVLRRSPRRTCHSTRQSGSGGRSGASHDESSSRAYAPPASPDKPSTAKLVPPILASESLVAARSGAPGHLDSFDDGATVLEPHPAPASAPAPVMTEMFRDMVKGAFSGEREQDYAPSAAGNLNA